MQKFDIHNGDTDQTVIDTISANSNVVLVFSASWCGPCKRLYPAVKRCAEANSAVIFRIVDVDDFSKVSEKFSVSAMPTVVFFKDGKEISRLRGASEQLLFSETEKLISLKVEKSTENKVERTADESAAKDDKKQEILEKYSE